MLELITTIAATLLLVLTIYTIFGIVNELNELEMRIKNLEKDLGKDPQGPRSLEARTGEQMIYMRGYIKTEKH